MEATGEKKPARGGTDDNAEMDVLSFAEDRADKTLVVLRQSYDDLHERAYKLATVLVAGAGAAGAYALGKLGSSGSTISWAPIAGLSLSWMGVAAVLVWRGATTRKLSPGNGPSTLLSYYRDRLAESGDAAVASQQTREAELLLQQARIEAYQDGCIVRADAIDTAYKAAVICSPLVPATITAACLALA